MNLTQIHQKIYLINANRMMLDFDLAELYDVETRVLKQAVRRNLDRFPEDFMISLSKGTEKNNFLIFENHQSLDQLLSRPEAVIPGRLQADRESLSMPYVG